MISENKGYPLSYRRRKLALAALDTFVWTLLALYSVMHNWAFFAFFYGIGAALFARSLVLIALGMKYEREKELDPW